MKFNYTNILFSLSLNILLLSSQVCNQRNHNLTLHKRTTTSRLLCECELYAPANYDNDPEMKSVMQDFDRQTSQRFEEYSERMIKNGQKCKEQCEKDIQKIILKDKLEKELTEKLSTLQTDISTNDIPTCVCEKFVTDKTEKLCLQCGYGLGSNVPLVGHISGIGFYTELLKYAVDCGIFEEARVAASATVKTFTELLAARIPGLQTLKIDLAGIMTKNTYKTPVHLAQAIDNAVVKSCTPTTVSPVPPAPVCSSPSVELSNLNQTVPQVLVQASEAGKEAGIVAGKAAHEKAWSASFTWENFLSSSLGISIIVTVCIVVMLIIIYLILRYRRKKKIKKKLQYIKLLKE
ncbi:PIR protein, putative [Plasmodium sp. gorilla clade G1]|nr:PIR protein, putative [Plasmodium sp. gorilla clade G1]